MRKLVSVEKHVAVGLFINFPLEKNIDDVNCSLAWENLQLKWYVKSLRKLCVQKIELFIRFPYTKDEVQEAIDAFEEEYKFSQIVGAIDRCHMVINVLPENNWGRLL